ncbi:hypothetical protein A1F94_002827 [Pyrenophora tritici-repentis]|nr:hypothetical protein A1F94_002827 [Pyrenophora tritici-repentis]
MGRYETIKAHTNVAISWIVETACAHGNGVRFDEPHPPVVSTEEILRQGQYLQDLGVTIVMLSNVWCSFREAVRGRQKYADKFAQEQPEHQGNAGHVYFLDVLRRVTEMLSEVIQVQRISSSQNETQENSSRFSNLFEALSIDEVDEPIESQPHDDPVTDDSALKESNKPSTTRYEPAIDVSEELNLRWYCFRDEVISITGWVSQMWAGYTKSGNIKDLWLVTLLSDLAIEMIFKLYEELPEKLKTDEESTKVGSARYNRVIYPPPTIILAKEYDALVSWTRNWPGQATRYAAIRNIDSIHPLAGYHRDMWKHFDMPIAVKENVCEQYSHLPDHEGDQQARLKYSENFIMPLEDPNFLRKKNPLVPGN